MAEPHDIVIIGGGAAGFTAGMFAARDRQRTLLLEKFSAGGQVLNCEHIENYPGFPDGIAGYSFGPQLQQQAMNMGLEMKLAEVQAVQLDGNLKVLSTDDGEVRAKALIVATGASFTKLNLPGEAEFLGNGVSHCASCDGAFFMDQSVVVVGGGDAALDEGLHLTQYASLVTIVHRREELRACQLLQERAHSTEKIAFRWNTLVRAIEGEGTVQKVQLEDVTTGERSSMDVSGVFLFIGLTPNTQFLTGLIPLNDRGQIVTDLWMRTPVPGILAAGDIRHASARQLVSSAGDGATAATAAIRYLQTGEWGMGRLNPRGVRRKAKGGGGQQGVSRGRACRAGRGVDYGGQNWRAFLRGRAVSAWRGAVAPNGRMGEREKKKKSPILPFAHSSPEACFLKAIDIARQQHAKSWELRAMMSLSRLWQSQGKKDEV